MEAGPHEAGVRPKEGPVSPKMAENGPPRRRKKFEYRGVKTFEIARGRFGFGFTLSGQNPCILSSVIPGSPAELSGLKSGDSLITVNSNNVSRLPHGEVVRLISQSQGLIRVQVTEANSSDSSSDDEGGRRRPRHLYRRQMRRDPPLTESNQASKSRGDYDNIDLFSQQRAKQLEERLHQSRDVERFSDGERQKDRSIFKHVRSNSADSSLIGDLPVPSSTPKKSENLQKKVELAATEELSIGGELRESLNPTIRELRQSMKLHNQKKLNLDLTSSLLQCIVGYLGTIELGLDSTNELQGIRNCIRRLRVEKKVHTLVLFAIFEDRIVLINHHGLRLAEFKSGNISFCGVCEDDKRFFGLVTSQLESSSSCHVFMVEPTNSEHERLQRARVFNITPTYSDTGECCQFPLNADPILSVIYTIKGVNAAEQPQPELQENVVSSSSSSSNSDSGIGFRDELLHTTQGGERTISVNSVEAQGSSREEDTVARSLEEVSKQAVDGEISANLDEVDGAQLNCPSDSNDRSQSKLTVRAMPDPSVSNPPSADSSFNTDRLECLQSAEHIRLSMHKYLQDKHEHLKRASQQLADKRASGQSSHDTGLQNVQRLIREKFESRAETNIYTRSRPDHTEGTPTPSISERSFVRSLEDLRSVSQVERSSLQEEADFIGPPSLPVLSSLPLARFLCTSDSNLSQLEGRGSWSNLAALGPQEHPLNRWQEKQTGFSSVLRPCDQYPVEPVIKLRARSQVSNLSHRSSMFEFSDYDNISCSGPHSAASTLSRRRRQEPSIQEEKENLERTSVPGDLESVASRRENTLDRVRTRRKSDSESIQGLYTQEDKGGSKEKDIGRVGGWAADFDKLLNDPAGLQTFAEFLKKEFSHENIYFWCCCERYRKIQDGLERLKIAKEIVEKHLGAAATEPVNVDAVARSSTAEALQTSSETKPPAVDLFSTAQKQIYNLMKFDSFSRFLKSDLYKESLLADMGGSPLPFNGTDNQDPELCLDLNQTQEVEKKKKEEPRRKSILPWGNIRNRSKSKDRVDQEKPSLFRGIKLPVHSVGRLSLNSEKNDTKGADSKSPEQNSFDSRTSRNSESRNSLDSNHQTDTCDTENCSLTRFILPDKATTVVTPTPGESIRWLISKLLDKRGLKYTSFDAFLPGNDKPLDLSEDCATLGCTEVRVEPRVLFRLELPSKKSIGVKAKQTKLVEEVLRPILQQYGWNLDHMTVQVERQGSKHGVDYRSSVTSIDNCRLAVSYLNQDVQNRALDEIIKRNSDNDSIKTDSRPDSRNSGQTGAFRRQSSSSMDSKRMDEGLMPPPTKIPSIRRRPPHSSPIQSVREQEASLYEGLKRMTQGRLDDQRGLEINGELPDFLKKTENQDSRKSEDWNEDTREDNLLSRLSGPIELGDIHGWDKDHAHRYLDYIDSTFTVDGCLPTLEQAEEIFASVNPEESMNFNESRHSLGLHRLSIDGMKVVSRPSIGFSQDYEPLNRLSRGQNKDYEHIRNSSDFARSAEFRRNNINNEKDYEQIAFRQSPLPQPPSTHLQSPILPPPPLSQSVRQHPPMPHSLSQPTLGQPPPVTVPRQISQPSLHQAAPPPPPMKPRLNTIGERFQAPPKRPPPPLPPKPARGGQGPSHHPVSAENIPVIRTKSGVYMGIPGEKGYNVSFV